MQSKGNMMVTGSVAVSGAVGQTGSGQWSWWGEQRERESSQSEVPSEMRKTASDGGLIFSKD